GIRAANATSVLTASQQPISHAPSAATVANAPGGSAASRGTARPEPAAASTPRDPSANEPGRRRRPSTMCFPSVYLCLLLYACASRYATDLPTSAVPWPGARLGGRRRG